MLSFLGLLLAFKLQVECESHSWNFGSQLNGLYLEFYLRIINLDAYVIIIFFMFAGDTIQSFQSISSIVYQLDMLEGTLPFLFCRINSGQDFEMSAGPETL